MRRDNFTLPLLAEELIIDNFAGGGGTSTGLEAAFGRPVDIAINHDQEALAMHAANHPHTKHLCESVWEVDPREIPGPVGLVWLSPDCKHFSKAKGGKPVEKRIRGLAWVALRWAATKRPRVIMLENVEEFVTWGPLVEQPDGTMRPCPKRKGRVEIVIDIDGTRLPITERGTDFRTWQRDNLERLAAEMTRRMVAEHRRDNGCS